MFESILRRKKFVLLDGGLATDLERHGASFDGTKLWSAAMLKRNPAAIRESHVRFLAAGADVLTTASYQATLKGFAAEGIDAEEGRRLIHLSIDLAVDAIREFGSADDDEKLIAVSLGTFGAHLANGAEYTGDFSAFSRQDIVAFHRQQLEIVVQHAHCSLVAFETLPSFVELQAIVELLLSNDQFLRKSYWFSFCCRDEHSLSDGTPIQRCVELLSTCSELLRDRIVAVGVNCTNPKFVSSLLNDIKAARKASDRFELMCYPNSGELFDATTQLWNGEHCSFVDDESMLREWFVDIGARVIGGCCRVSPQQIARIDKILRTFK